MKFKIKPKQNSKSPALVEYGEVTRYGVKILDDGSQWVIDGMTGQPILKKNAELISVTQRGSVWVSKGRGKTFDATSEGVYFSLWRQ